MTGTRLPHSEIPGSKRACRSPRLIAACRVLHRLPSPRHPSCALTSLTTKKSIRIDCRISGAGTQQVLSRTHARHPLVPRARPFNSRSYACAVVKEPFVNRVCFQTRRVPPDFSMLAQYGRMLWPGSTPRVSDRRRRPSPEELVGVPGVEPGTSSLSGTRSNQLSYTPILGGGWPLYWPPTCYLSLSRPGGAERIRTPDPLVANQML